MKRIVSILLFLAVLCSLLPMAHATETLIAYAVEGGNIYFDPATGTVREADPTVTSAVIPEEIDGVAVTSIGDCLFADYGGVSETLKSVTLPESIQTIGYEAFYNCAGLTEIKIPSQVKVIHYHTFYNCKSLTDVTLPDALQEIETMAFSHCESLSKIAFPDGLKNIATMAFEYCSALDEISLPENLQSIDAAAFIETKYYNDKANWKDHYLLLEDWLLKIEEKEYYKIDIPQGVKHVAAFAGRNLGYLSELILPEGLESVGERAFEKTYVEQIIFPASVNYIGTDAFSGRNGLWAFFQGNAPAVAGNPFDGYNDLVFYKEGTEGWTSAPWTECSLNVWDGVNAYPRAILYPVEGGILSFSPMDGCINWTMGHIVEARIPSEIGGFPVKRIRENAFSGRHDLVWVEIPASVEIIDADAFRICTSLEYAVFLGNPPAAFGEKKGENDYYSVFWPDEDFVIYCADESTEWTTPSWQCYQALPLSKAEHLHDISITNGTISCEDMTEVTFGCTCGFEKTITQYSTGHSYDDNGICICCGMRPSGTCGEALTWSFDMQSGNLTISGSGAMQDFNEVPWDEYRTQIKNVIFDGGITHIGARAFRGLPELEKMVLPESVISIGTMAFAECHDLKEMKLPDGIQSIGEKAFSKCQNLSEITMPLAIVQLPNGIFDGCKELKEVILPEGLVEIGEQAFNDCKKLEGIKLPDTLLNIGNYAFKNCTNIQLQLPKNLQRLGDGALQACEAITSVVVPASVTYFGDSAFYKCTGLTSVRIDAQIEEIGWIVFCECESLTDVILPQSVKQIGMQAFTRCKSLKQIQLPNRLTTIGYASFQHCSSLEKIHIPETVESIEAYAFGCCDHLTGVYFYGNAPKLSDDVFRIWDVTNQAYVNHPDLMLYYLADKEGWTSPEWNGYPTAVYSGHEHIYETMVIPPTCTEQGYTTYTCTVCADRYEGDYVEPTGHDYEADVVAPTCTEQGYTTYTCTVCADSYEGDHVEATGHDYEADVVAPTCTEQGYTTYTCTVCADSYEGDHVEATGHDYEADVVAPTCTEQGYTTYTCTVCADSYEGDHVEATGHDYEADVVAPTCTEQGYTTYTCAVCADSYVADAVKPTGHTYVDGVCTACGEEEVVIEFIDVVENAWYAEAVQFAVSNKLMNGMGGNKFEPETPMSRAMLVTVLWRYAGEPTEGENIFTDVGSDTYYTKAVAWAACNEIVGGVGNGKFDPNGNITREQMAAILYRYATKLGIDTSKCADLTSFPDANKVSSWASEALSWANAEGLITGSKIGNNNYLDPQGNATRAQVATILMRFIENVLG